jgi:hypothetical protein
LTPVVGESSNTPVAGAVIQFSAPLCRKHAELQFKRSVVANALLFAAVFLLFAGVILPLLADDPIWAILTVLGVIALIVIAFATQPAVRARINAWPNPSRITLMGVSATFAAALRDSAQHVASLPHSAHRLAGSVLAFCGTGLAVLSGFLVSGIIYSRINSQQHSVVQNFGPYAVVILIGSVGGAVGILMRRAGKRLAMPSVAELLAADHRPPILYLRAFDDDEAGHQAEATVPWFQGQQLPTGFGASVELKTFEELLAEELAWLGPVVAIGRPGDFRPLPRVGAARMWVKDDWENVVRGFLPRTRMVVLLMGRFHTEMGLAWEWAQVQAVVPPEQILLVMPPVDTVEARARWAGFQQRAAGRLPAYREGIIAARFGPGWECRLFVAALPVGNPAEYRAAVAEADPAVGWVMASSPVLACEPPTIAAVVHLDARQEDPCAKRDVPLPHYPKAEIFPVDDMADVIPFARNMAKSFPGGAGCLSSLAVMAGVWSSFLWLPVTFNLAVGAAVGAGGVLAAVSTFGLIQKRSIHRWVRTTLIPEGNKSDIDFERFLRFLEGNFPSHMSAEEMRDLRQAVSTIRSVLADAGELRKNKPMGDTHAPDAALDGRGT